MVKKKNTSKSKVTEKKLTIKNLNVKNKSLVNEIDRLSKKYDLLQAEYANYKRRKD